MPKNSVPSKSSQCLFDRIAPKAFFRSPKVRSPKKLIRASFSVAGKFSWSESSENTQNDPSLLEIISTCFCIENAQRQIVPAGSQGRRRYKCLEATVYIGSNSISPCDVGAADSVLSIDFLVAAHRKRDSRRGLEFGLVHRPTHHSDYISFSNREDNRPGTCERSRERTCRKRVDGKDDLRGISVLHDGRIRSGGALQIDCRQGDAIRSMSKSDEKRQKNECSYRVIKPIASNSRYKTKR